jgi:hypothetical protein
MDTNEARLAVEVFELVMAFMGDLPAQRDPLEIADSIVRVAIQKPKLRDEIMCHVLKQLCQNRSPKMYVSFTQN